jgi:hypothetical protein
MRQDYAPDPHSHFFLTLTSAVPSADAMLCAIFFSLFSFVFFLVSKMESAKNTCVFQTKQGAYITSHHQVLDYLYHQALHHLHHLGLGAAADNVRRSCFLLG